MKVGELFAGVGGFGLAAEWIDTPTVKCTMQRPKAITWKLSREDPGKPTRWMNVGGIREWGPR